MISIEYFELTQSIATCQRKIGFINETCVLKDIDSTNQMRDLAGIGFFMDGTGTGKQGCGMFAEGMEEEDGNCYHTNMNVAFHS